MSATTTPVARYTTIDRLPVPPGGAAQQQLARMRARLIARYNLEAIPGRPEELIKPGSVAGVSLGYGCKTVRVRGMIGREWVESLTHDFQIGEGWGNALYALLDLHFGFAPHQSFPIRPLTDVQAGLGDPLLPEHPDELSSFPVRPIRDNPQA